MDLRIDDQAFRPITVGDRSVLETFMRRANYPLCEYCASIQICWQEYNHSEWMVLDGQWLLIRYLDEGCLRFLCPVGDGDIRPVIEACCLYLADRGETPHITFVPDAVRTMLGDGAYRFESDPGESDYLYRREDLAGMLGRRMSRKRNHVKRFQQANPDWRVDPFRPELAGEWRAFVDEWCAQNHCSQHPVLAFEVEALRRWIEWHEQLPMQAFALRVAERIVGVSVGEMMTPDTFVVHYEKALRQFDGAYPMLTWLAARDAPPETLMVNREQDMNEPGLRTSKESFFPDHLEPAFTAIPR